MGFRRRRETDPGWRAVAVAVGDVEGLRRDLSLVAVAREARNRILTFSPGLGRDTDDWGAPVAL